VPSSTSVPEETFFLQKPLVLGDPPIYSNIGVGHTALGLLPDIKS
jgi:hypothetical protein